MSNVCFKYLFPDSNADETTSKANDSKSCEEQNEIVRRLTGKCNLIKASDNDSSSVLNKLAICIAALNVQSQTKAIAQIWNEFMLEIRFRWDSNILITGVSTGLPDLSRCLLHQKLQMLNNCIEKKIERDQIAASNRTDLNDDNDDEFFDCIESSSEWQSQADDVKQQASDGRLKKFGDLMLLNKNEPLYIPITQVNTDVLHC